MTRSREHAAATGGAGESRRGVAAKIVRAIGSTAALALALASAPPGARAHADAAHDAPRAAASKEQMPWGIAGDARAAKRRIEIRMLDTMRFVPDRIEVREGETVRLVLRNSGKILHELVLGTKPTLEEHAALMMKFPDMEHDEPYMAHVAPGRRGEIVWTFNRAGEFDFACLIAGHYQAGMVGKVRVVSKR